MQVAKEHLAVGTSIAVGMLPVLLHFVHPNSSLPTTGPDNTNADRETRAVWVKVAQALQIPLRCVYFTAPPKLCEHNDTVRALSQGLVRNPYHTQILDLQPLPD